MTNGGARLVGPAVGERGSVLPLVAVVLAVTLAMVLAVAELGARAVARAEAQTAADAAALAGVVDGESGARRLAAANDAELITFSELEGLVQVEVRRGRAVASAAAELGWRAFDAEFSGESGSPASDNNAAEPPG